MEPQLTATFKRAKAASRELALIDEQRKNDVLNAVADAIATHSASLLEANARDLARMDPSNPLYDRLLLDEKRLAGIASDMRHVAELPTPLGKVLIDKLYKQMNIPLKHSDTPREVEKKVFRALSEAEISKITADFESIRYAEHEPEDAEAAAILSNICGAVKRYMY